MGVVLSEISYDTSVESLMDAGEVHQILSDYINTVVVEADNLADSLRTMLSDESTLASSNFVLDDGFEPIETICTPILNSLNIDDKVLENLNPILEAAKNRFIEEATILEQKLSEQETLLGEMAARIYEKGERINGETIISAEDEKYLDMINNEMAIIKEKRQKISKRRGELSGLSLSLPE